MADLAPPDFDDLPITPGTRSSAEAALMSNTLTQTASAGQAPSSVSGRPPFPTRSSNNYINAATEAATRNTAANPPINLAPRPRSIAMPVSQSAEDLAAQNAAAEAAFLAEQDAAKRSSVDMRSDSIAGALTGAVKAEVNGTGAGVTPKMLGLHGRQQSWNKEDLKRMMQEPLMKDDSGDGKGYSGKGGGVTGY